MVSTTPSIIAPSWVAAAGPPSASSRRISSLTGGSLALALERQRFGCVGAGVGQHRGGLVRGELFAVERGEAGRAVLPRRGAELRERGGLVEVGLAPVAALLRRAPLGAAHVLDRAAVGARRVGLAGVGAAAAIGADALDRDAGADLRRGGGARGARVGGADARARRALADRRRRARGRRGRARGRRRGGAVR